MKDEIFLIVENKQNKIVTKNMGASLNVDTIDFIKKEMMIFKSSSFKTVDFLNIESYSIINYNENNEFFKNEFNESIKKILLGNKNDLKIFENYVLYLFCDDINNQHYIFKSFENSLRVKRKKPKIFFSRDFKENIDLHYSSPEDISIPLNFDFKFVVNSVDRTEFLHIVNMPIINNFFKSPIDETRLKNIKLLKDILENNQLFFREEKDTSQYLKYIPIYRHKDIEEIIKNQNLIISEENKIIIENLGFLDKNSKEGNIINMTRLKHVVALLVNKIWKDDKGEWWCATHSEKINIENSLLDNDRRVFLLENSKNKEYLKLV